MADDLRLTLQRIMSKARLLTERYVAMMQAKKAADIHVKELIATNEQLRLRIQQLEQQLEFMKVASTFAPSREEVAKSRAFLSELVREIDSCINDLND